MKRNVSKAVKAELFKVAYRLAFLIWAVVSLWGEEPEFSLFGNNSIALRFF